MTIATAITVTCCLLFGGSSVSAGPDITDDWVRREVSRVVKWRGFWEGTDFLTGYAPGKKVPLTVVESPDEVAVFAAGIRLAFYFERSNGKVVRVRLRDLPNTTNEFAARQYVADYAETAGFVLGPNANASPGVPVHKHRPEKDPERRALKQHSLWLILPRLEPPEYIRTRHVARDLPELESSVRLSVAALWAAGCGSGEALIPKFSHADPLVYVLVDLGKCGKGILPFAPGPTGNWSPGRFSPDKPPNDWSHTIRQIRHNTLVRVPLTAGVNP